MGDSPYSCRDAALIRIVMPFALALWLASVVEDRGELSADMRSACYRRLG